MSAPADVEATAPSMTPAEALTALALGPATTWRTDDTAALEDLHARGLASCRTGGTHDPWRLRAVTDAGRAELGRVG